MQNLFLPQKHVLASKQSPADVMLELERHLSEKKRFRAIRTLYLGKVDRSRRHFRIRVSSIEGKHNNTPVWAEGWVESAGNGSKISFSLGLSRRGKILWLSSLTILSIGVSIGAVMGIEGGWFGSWKFFAAVTLATLLAAGTSVFFSSLKMKRESKVLEEYIRNCC